MIYLKRNSEKRYSISRESRAVSHVDCGKHILVVKVLRTVFECVQTQYQTENVKNVFKKLLKYSVIKMESVYCKRRYYLYNNTTNCFY